MRYDGNQFNCFYKIDVVEIQIRVAQSIPAPIKIAHILRLEHVRREEPGQRGN